MIISLKPFLPALDYFVLLSKMLLKTQPLPLPPLPAPPPLFSFFIFIFVRPGGRTRANTCQQLRACSPQGSPAEVVRPPGRTKIKREMRREGEEQGEEGGEGVVF